MSTRWRTFFREIFPLPGRCWRTFCWDASSSSAHHGYAGDDEGGNESYGCCCERRYERPAAEQVPGGPERLCDNCCCPSEARHPFYVGVFAGGERRSGLWDEGDYFPHRQHSYGGLWVGCHRRCGRHRAHGGSTHHSSTASSAARCGHENCENTRGDEGVGGNEDWTAGDCAVGSKSDARYPQHEPCGHRHSGRPVAQCSQRLRPKLDDGERARRYANNCSGAHAA